jgi:hypothetical protein
MQYANLSDDELWRAIAQNTATMSALFRQQAELKGRFQRNPFSQAGLDPLRK